MMQENTTQTRKQLKPTHLHIVRSLIRDLAKMTRAEEGVQNKRSIDTKEAFNYKMQR